MVDHSHRQKYSAQVSKTIGTVHLMLAVLALAVYLGASLSSQTLPLLSLGSFFTVCFFASAFIQRTMRVTQERAVWVMAATDILLFTLVIWSFAPLYGGVLTAALKSPTYTFIFALLALQALRGDGRLVLFLGGVAIGARLVMLLTALQDGAATTVSYSWYQNSSALMLAGEGELILALLLFSVFLSAAVRRLSGRSAAVPEPKAVAPLSEPVMHENFTEAEELVEGVINDPEKELLLSLETEPLEEEPVDDSADAGKEFDEETRDTETPVKSPTRVLIAEDSQVNMMVLEKMLAPPDFYLLMAEDGQEAFELFERQMAEKEAPDIVLLDIEMPLMNGYEVARKIREYERARELAPLPIIAVTALGDDSHKEASFESGMNDHLVKPVKKEELLTAITKALAISARN